MWDQVEGGEVAGPMYGHGQCDGDGDGIRGTAPPVSEDECRNGGWATFANPSSRNQGQCVNSVAKRA